MVRLLSSPSDFCGGNRFFGLGYYGKIVESGPARPNRSGWTGGVVEGHFSGMSKGGGAPLSIHEGMRSQASRCGQFSPSRDSGIYTP